MLGRRRLTLACAGVAGALAFGVGASAATKSAPRPDIWGVWMGLTGAEGADPRFGNTPYPTVPGFTAWGAEQSRKEGTALTPGECNPWSPMGFMGATGLFPIQILQGPNLIVIHHEAIVQPRRVYTDGRSHACAGQRQSPPSEHANLPIAPSVRLRPGVSGCLTTSRRSRQISLVRLAILPPRPARSCFRHRPRPAGLRDCLRPRRRGGLGPDPWR